jgi:type I restriction enzyme R subunit
MKQLSDGAFETAIEAVLLGEGYTRVEARGFDRERSIFPDEALSFIRTMQPEVWKKLESLHGQQTGARVLESLRKWLVVHGTLTTPRHGFKGFGKMTRFADTRKERRATLITAAVTGQIPLEEMTG